jgi:hypothetical protein
MMLKLPKILGNEDASDIKDQWEAAYAMIPGRNFRRLLRNTHVTVNDCQSQFPCLGNSNAEWRDQ